MEDVDVVDAREKEVQNLQSHHEENRRGTVQDNQALEVVNRLIADTTSQVIKQTDSCEALVLI